MWFPQRTVCHSEMERAAAERRYSKLHEALPYHDGTFTSWAKESSAAHPYHFHDGVTIWVAREDVNPDDDFLTRGAGGVRAGEDEAEHPEAD